MTLEEAGMGLMSLADLLLKQLYLQGNMLGVQLARNVRLAFQLVEEALRFLKAEKCLEVVSGDLIGPASYRFNLTELGRRRAQECFQQCRYVGPAPVASGGLRRPMPQAAGLQRALPHRGFAVWRLRI